MGSHSDQPSISSIMGMRSCRDQHSICRDVEMESQGSQPGTRGDTRLGISTADVGTRHWDPMGPSTALRGTWGVGSQRNQLLGSVLWAVGPRLQRVSAPNPQIQGAALCRDVARSSTGIWGQHSTAAPCAPQPPPPTPPALPAPLDLADVLDEGTPVESSRLTPHPTPQLLPVHLQEIGGHDLLEVIAGAQQLIDGGARAHVDERAPTDLTWGVGGGVPL